MHVPVLTLGTAFRGSPVAHLERERVTHE
jgi:hypothetical protein